MFKAAGFGILLLTLLYGPFRIPRSDQVFFEFNSLIGFGLSVGLVLLGNFRRLDTRLGRYEVFGWVSPLLILLISDIPFRGKNFLQPNHFYMELLLALAIGICARHLLKQRFAKYLSIAIVIFSIVVFHQFLGSRLLFSDDHPSFLYRLAQLRESFPYIPFYNPLWNGGVEAREFFPSGALGLYFLGLPFVYLGDLVLNYNFLVSFILFVVCPIAVGSAARLLGMTKEAAYFSGFLGITSSLTWYVWGLSYGTMGFVVATISFPIVVAGVSKALTRSLSNFESFLIFVSTSLMLFWSLSLIFVIPLAVLVVLFMKRAPARFALLGIAVALILVHLPWMIIFAKASNVFDFVVKDSKVISGEHIAQQNSVIPFREPIQFSVANSLRQLRAAFNGINPIVALMMLPGVYFMSGVARVALGLSLLWLFSVATLGNFFKPQLELARLYMVGGMLATIPAGNFCAELLRQERSRIKEIAVAIVLSLFIYLFYWQYRVLSNQTFVKYYAASSEVGELSDIIKAQSPYGRTMFAGFTLHELSHGHVAPLAAFTNAPLIASRYQHDRWHYVDVVPEEYRKRKLKGVKEFLSLYNVGTVITHDKFWTKWYQSKSESFKKVTTIGRFNVFAVLNSENSYFYRGQGQIIRQTGSAVVIKVLSRESVVKFNFLPFLESSSCQISPYSVSDTISFVRISECSPGTIVEIRAVPPWQRLFE